MIATNIIFVGIFAILAIFSHGMEGDVESINKLPSNVHVRKFLDPRLHTGVSSPQEVEPLTWELINPTARVTLKRIDRSEGQGNYFRVDPKSKGERPSEYYRIYSGKLFTKKDGKPRRAPSRTPKITDECDGRPGIRAFLRKDDLYCCLPCLTLPRPESPTVFCYDGVHILVYPDRESGSHMTIIAKFKDQDKKENIGIIMHPYKQSIEEVNSNQASSSQSSSSSSLVDPSSPIQSIIENTDGSPLFISDILWMKDMLNRAEFAGSEKDPSGTYTEYYWAGPVELKPDSFYEILQFGYLMKAEDLA